MNEIFEQINERGEIIKKAMHVVEQTTSSSQDWRPVSFFYPVVQFHQCNRPNVSYQIAPIETNLSIRNSNDQHSV